MFFKFLIGAIKNKNEYAQVNNKKITEFVKSLFYQTPRTLNTIYSTMIVEDKKRITLWINTSYVNLVKKEEIQIYEYLVNNIRHHNKKCVVIIDDFRLKSPLCGSYGEYQEYFDLTKIF